MTRVLSPRAQAPRISMRQPKRLCDLRGLRARAEGAVTSVLSPMCSSGTPPAPPHTRPSLSRTPPRSTTSSAMHDAEHRGQHRRRAVQSPEPRRQRRGRARRRELHAERKRHAHQHAGREQQQPAPPRSGSASRRPPWRARPAGVTAPKTSEHDDQHERAARRPRAPRVLTAHAGGQIAAEPARQQQRRRARPTARTSDVRAR